MVSSSNLPERDKPFLPPAFVGHVLNICKSITQASEKSVKLRHIVASCSGYLYYMNSFFFFDFIFYYFYFCFIVTFKYCGILIFWLWLYITGARQWCFTWEWETRQTWNGRSLLKKWIKMYLPKMANALWINYYTYYLLYCLLLAFLCIFSLLLYRIRNDKQTRV